MQNRNRGREAPQLSSDPKQLVVELFYIAADLQWSNPAEAETLRSAALELELHLRRPQAIHFSRNFGSAIYAELGMTKH